MKHYNQMRLGICLLLAFGLVFTSCEDDLTLNVGDDSALETVDGTYGSVRSAAGAAQLTKLVVKNNVKATGHVYFELSSAATSSVQVTFKLDQDALDEYNSANGTSYEMYPSSYISLGNSGTVTIASGSKKSDYVDIDIAPCGNVGTVYAVAISATATNGVEVSSNNDYYIYLVEDWGVIADPSGKGDVKNVLYVEVNNESILNAGEYTVNGYPYFDVVSIFAANINLDSEGRPYIYCNDQVAFVLANAENTIRPLQKKGIKVNLSILGNHDDAGMRSLNEAGAEYFANELQTYLDVYGLDGFDFDDEYSAYAEGNYRGTEAGVVSSDGDCTSENYYTLMQICREKMPDALLGIYWYTGYDHPIGDGLEDIIDYTVYGSYGSWFSYYGYDMPAAQQAPYAINLTSSYGATLTPRTQYVSQLVSDGYGYMGYYNMGIDCIYTACFNQISETLYGADVDWTGKYYDRTDLVASQASVEYEDFLGDWTVTSSSSLFYYYDEEGNPRWWDWGSSQTFTVTIEQDVYGESFKMYGWDGEAVTAELPVTLNYQGGGIAYLPAPQLIGSVDGVEYAVARATYYNRPLSWYPTTTESANAFNLEVRFAAGTIEMYDTNRSRYGLGVYTYEDGTYTSTKEVSEYHSCGVYTFVAQ